MNGESRRLCVPPPSSTTSRIDASARVPTRFLGLQGRRPMASKKSSDPERRLCRGGPTFGWGGSAPRLMATQGTYLLSALQERPTHRWSRDQPQSSRSQKLGLMAGRKVSVGELCEVGGGWPGGQGVKPRPRPHQPLRRRIETPATRTLEPTSLDSPSTSLSTHRKRK